MLRGVVGLIGTRRAKWALEAVGVEGDVALTPFGGRYRVLDLAVATMLNSGIETTFVTSGGPAGPLRSHLAGAHGMSGGTVRPLPEARTPRAGSQLGRLLRACGALVRSRGADAVAVLTADHVLQTHLAPLAAMHRDTGADLTLAALPASCVDGATARPLLNVDGAGTVAGDESTGAGDAVLWTGDFMVRAAAVPLLLDAIAGMPATDSATLLRTLASRFRVTAHDVLAPAAAGPARGPYWHDLTTLEAYYAAQMDLCTPHPAFDLNDAAWPLPAPPSRLGPARLVSDAGGRAGRVLNTVLSEGCIIRGALVRNTVLGHGAIVDSCAEVEDSVLLDGCRIGAGAQVRRAVVGPGAVVADGDSVGYDALPPGATGRPSGLTLVAPTFVQTPSLAAGE